MKSTRSVQYAFVQRAEFPSPLEGPIAAAYRRMQNSTSSICAVAGEGSKDVNATVTKHCVI